MARKTVEKNIAYDDVRKKFYVTRDYGKDEKGNRVKKTATANSKSEAKKILGEFNADKIKGTLVLPKSETLEETTSFTCIPALTSDRDILTLDLSFICLFYI